MKDEIKTAYADWGVILGWCTGAVALFSFFVTVLTTPLADVLAGFLEAYRTLFHFPFRILAKFLAIDLPGWLRDVVVFWLVFGGVGARVYLRLMRVLLDRCLVQREKVDATLADPDRLQSLIRHMGSREAVDRETAFLDGQIAFARETFRRRTLLVVGCLVTGPLFAIGAAWYNPPLFGQRGSGRWLLLIEFLALGGAVLALFLLNWSLD